MGLDSSLNADNKQFQKIINQLGTFILKVNAIYYTTALLYFTENCRHKPHCPAFSKSVSTFFLLPHSHSFVYLLFFAFVGVTPTIKKVFTYSNQNRKGGSNGAPALLRHKCGSHLGTMVDRRFGAMLASEAQFRVR